MGESPPKSTMARSSGHEGPCRLAWWTLTFALICGGTLRWVWIDDMEWKDDEKWSYRMSQEVGRTRPWSWVGMPTSLGFPNPGMSEWVFIAIGRVARRPTSMARTVVMLNMIGLIGFAGAVRAFLPPTEREPWIWGLALQAVSPYAIRLSRKIWPPSSLTPLVLMLWIGHQYRQTRWGAFSWGLVGALIGQVHLSGWFVAAGLVVGTVVAECVGKLPRSRYWHYWLLGNALGLIGAFRWARDILNSPHAVPEGFFELDIIHRLAGYLYAFVSIASSVSPMSVLGLGRDAFAYEKGPIIDGIPMNAPELIRQFLALAVLLRLAVRLINGLLAPGLRWAKRTIAQRAGSLTNAEASASTEPARSGRGGAVTAFYLWTTLVIPGTLFVLTTKYYFFHYYFVMCPFLFVSVAVFFLPWRRLLLSIVIAQALLSYVFLSYIHHKRGPILGDYGWSYARQQAGAAGH